MDKPHVFSISHVKSDIRTQRYRRIMWIQIQLTPFDRFNASISLRCIDSLMFFGNSGLNTVARTPMVGRTGSPIEEVSLPPLSSSRSYSLAIIISSILKVSQ